MENPETVAIIATLLWSRAATSRVTEPGPAENYIGRAVEIVQAAREQQEQGLAGEPVMRISSKAGSR